MTARKLLASVLLLLVLSMMAGCADGDEVAGPIIMPSGTSGGTRSFDVAPVSAAPKVVWSVQLPNAVSRLVYCTSLLADGSVAYVGMSDGRLHAFDLSTGKLIWSYGRELEPGSDTAMLIYGIVGQRLYIGRPWDQTVQRLQRVGTVLNAKNGHVVREREWSGEFLLLYQDKLYFDRSILDRKTGERLAERESPRTYNSFVVADGRIVQETADLRICAYEAGNGAPSWTTQLTPYPSNDVTGKASRTLLTRPTAANGMVYAVTYLWYDEDVKVSAPPAARLIALAADSGEIVWQQDLGVAFGRSQSPQVAGNAVVVAGSLAGRRALLAAYDASTGAPLWERLLPDDYSPDYGGPSAIVGTTLYALYHLVDSSVQGIDLDTGKEVWWVDTRTDMYKGYATRLVPVEGGLVITTDDGTLKLIK